MAFEQQALQCPILFILERQAIHIVVAAHRQQFSGFCGLLLVDPTGQLTNAAAFTEAPRVAQHHHLLGERMGALGVFLQPTRFQAFAADGLQPLASLRAVPAGIGALAQIAQDGTGLDRGQLVLVAQQDQARLGRNAASTLAIISRSSMEASSTTSTSSGSGLPASWRKWRVPGGCRAGGAPW